jgi:hypothetical protein
VVTAPAGSVFLGIRPEGASDFAWTRLGQASEVPAVALGRNPDQRLELFATDWGTGSAWHSWQTAPGGGWADWQMMGGARGLGDIAVAANADGRLELFGTDANAGTAWHCWQRTAGVSDWSRWADWHMMGGAKGLGHIAVAASPNGRLEVFATDARA